MSRTIKGSKPIGYDIWGKKGAPHGCPSHSKLAKNQLTRKVRRAKREEEKSWVY